MSFTPDLAHQQQLADDLRRGRQQMTGPERAAEALSAVGFIAVTAVCWWQRPPQHFAIWPALLCVALVALATHVEFDTPFGFTVATQLAFVPLVFSVPVALVPLGVLIALLAAALPQVARGQIAPARLSKRIGNSWFALGPVVVFVLAGTSPRAASAWLLLAALGAQFLLDFALSAARVAIVQAASLAEQLKDAWVYAIDAALSGVGLVVAEVTHAAPYAPLALLPLLAVLAVFARERRTRLAQLLELNSAYRGTALVLGDVITADDGYTGEHSRSVVTLCLDVAARMRLTAQQTRNLEFGALLHDVGKIAIPKEIINKPGQLSEAEWTVIRTHTLEGQRLLDTIGGFMRDVGLIVRSHHERFDGGGYPDGLAGDAIPLESRIISCCDSWNAMRTNRSYRSALPFDVAVAEIEAAAGGQLDPEVVRVLLDVVRAEQVLLESAASTPTGVHSSGVEI